MEPCLSCFLTLECQEQGAAYELIPPCFENAVISSRLAPDQLQLDTALQEVEKHEIDGSTINSLQRCKYDNRDPVGGAVFCLLLY